ncbi:ADP-ribosylation factor-like protein 16 isoform X2 [Periophthalmus magnuspinnatus]|uniref:ADP-ribosylation factor-like protein 16 isoform X2 n=1 Tax=Periophthalmus magnuspinnatus TaxID=409849 RepID=UPI00243633A0|nr:ADP-ribosylation factor-like protein 16 isoform X2 [Periophthalmus magnuspinnatus]
MLANCCRWIKNPLCPCGQTDMIRIDTCLLLGATGVGKTLLLKRLQRFSRHGFDELEALPSTLPTVGTNLIDISLKRRKKFMVDASNTSQVSSSCIQLLSVLAAEPLQDVSVLLIFNKRDIPCLMSLIEIKSLFRLEDIITSATQSITTMELSASSGQGLQEVLTWLESVTVK